jgi:hypothetical protein
MEKHEVEGTGVLRNSVEAEYSRTLFLQATGALFRSSGRAGLTGSIIAKKMPSAQELQRLDLSRELEALETGRA